MEPTQDTGAGRSVFLHSGQIGDLIAGLSVMRAMGGGRLIVYDHPEHMRMSGWKWESVQPLLEVQPYLESVCFGSYPFRHQKLVDFTGFRRFHGDSGGNVIKIQARHLGQPDPGPEKWIHGVVPNPGTSGRIICCRSHRYRNYRFPWRKLAKRAGKRVLFIGTDDEHSDFEREVGAPVERLECANLLEVAQAIAGSDRFFGNQSSPFWVAAGLNHPLVQEVCLGLPDSVVPFEGAHYCANGYLDFDSLIP